MNTKKRLTNQEKLAKRKFGFTNRFLYFVYYFVMTKLVSIPYKAEYHWETKIPKKGPCFIIWNHLSRLDHIYLIKLAYPRRVNMVAGYAEFFRSHLHTVFRFNHCLPKKNFATDLNGMRAINSIIRKGGCVSFSPEGMSSMYGINQPIVAGTGHYLKNYRIPVYFVEMHGQYLTNNKCCLDVRSGKTVATLKLLFSPEQLDAMTSEEIDDKINEAFHADDYEWGKKNHIQWKTNNRICTNLHQICYRCPSCGKDSMHAEGNKIHCLNCGNGASMNDYYEFEPFSPVSVIPESPSKWVDWERIQIIREIREDKHYSVSTKVDLGYIPPYEWIPKKYPTTPCGEGVITFDHAGIHFDGTKLNEPFHFDLSYKTIFTLTGETDTNQFGLYVNGEYHEFSPKEVTVGKLLLLCEEMHRLHVNTWKNFSWNSYMYPEGETLPADPKEYGLD